MEDIRSYRMDEEKEPQRNEEREYEAATQREEVPFHIPRD
jgi:hypothetical protein